MKEPLAEIVQLPKSDRAQRFERAEQVEFLIWAFVFWVLFWSIIMTFTPGQVSAAWSKVKANWTAKQNEAAAALAAAQVPPPAPVAPPEFNDDDRAAIQEIVTLAAE